MVRIEFKDLIINEISDSSGVFSGDNLLVKWKAFIQSNEGYGSLSGENNRCVNNKSKVVKIEAEPGKDSRTCRG